MTEWEAKLDLLTLATSGRVIQNYAKRLYAEWEAPIIRKQSHIIDHEPYTKVMCAEHLEKSHLSTAGFELLTYTCGSESWSASHQSYTGSEFNYYEDWDGWLTKTDLATSGFEVAKEVSWTEHFQVIPKLARNGEVLHIREAVVCQRELAHSAMSDYVIITGSMSAQ